MEVWPAVNLVLSKKSTTGDKYPSMLSAAIDQITADTARLTIGLSINEEPKRMTNHATVRLMAVDIIGHGCLATI